MRRGPATRLALVVLLLAHGARATAGSDLSDGWSESQPKPAWPVELELAAKSGYGGDHFGFGLGGRFGVSILGIYGGVSLVRYFGGNVDSSGVDLSVSFVTYGGELGYGFKLGVLTIRPLVGFGLAAESFPTAQSPGTSSGSFYLQPGGLVELAFGHLIFGVDGSAFLPTRTPFADIGPTFTVQGQLGVTFDVPLPPGMTAP
jgi:hypothetical protein